MVLQGRAGRAEELYKASPKETREREGEIVRSENEPGLNYGSNMGNADHVKLKN